MKRIIFVLILIVSSVNLFSQDTIDTLDLGDFDFENDSTFINLDKEIEESQKIFDYSKGYFPKSLDIFSRWYLNWYIGNAHDQAFGIFSKSFRPTKFGFSGKAQDEDELETREKFSEDENSQGDKFNITMYSCIRLNYLMPVYVGYLGLGFGFDNIRGRLYSVDKTKSFLGYDNKPVSFKEISTVFFDETHFNLHANFILPIYGGLIKSKESIGSFYYLKFEYDYNYCFISDASQVIQIANHKDEIRYSNGNDYQYLFKSEELKTLERNRPYIGLGLGVIACGAGLDVKFEFNTKLSMNSILKDANWNQNFIYFNLGFSLDRLVSAIIDSFKVPAQKPTVKKTK